MKTNISNIKFDNWKHSISKSEDNGNLVLTYENTDKEAKILKIKIEEIINEEDINKCGYRIEAYTSQLIDISKLFDEYYEYLKLENQNTEEEGDMYAWYEYSTKEKLFSWDETYKEKEILRQINSLCNIDYKVREIKYDIINRLKYFDETSYLENIRYLASNKKYDLAFKIAEKTSKDLKNDKYMLILGNTFKEYHNYVKAISAYNKVKENYTESYKQANKNLSEIFYSLSQKLLSESKTNTLDKSKYERFLKKALYHSIEADQKNGKLNKIILREMLNNKHTHKEKPNLTSRFGTVLWLTDKTNQLISENKILKEKLQNQNSKEALKNNCEDLKVLKLNK